MKAVSGKDLAKILEKNGWKLRGVKGSHHIDTKEGNPARISVSVHANNALKIGLLTHLLKIAGIDPGKL